MNSTNRDRTAEMAFDPTRRTALVAGILYLVTFVASIPAVFLLSPLLNDANYVVGAGADMQVGLGAVLDMVNALAAIGTAVAVFSVVKRQHEGLALGFVTTRVMEAAIIAIGVVSLLGLVTLQQEGVAAGDAGAAVVVGRTLVAVRDWTFLLGPCLMPALNALLFGTLLYRARLVPRAIPALGLVGAPVMIAFVVATMLGLSELGGTFNGIAGAPFFFWELAVALWMTFKGFDRTAPIVAAAIAESAAAASSTMTARRSGTVATEAGTA
jgi:Domain of unknown function (DUF4386)